MEKRIIVCIKQTPDTRSVKMDEATGTVIREGVPAIVNPLDLYAIEAALNLRESYGGEITAVSMGPAKAIEALREAISMGIDNGVLLCDGAFAGSDTWATSYALAGAIKHLGGVDIILCGERATDGDTGQVGPGIAAWLDLPVATYVSTIETIEKKTCRLRRCVETGYETLTAKLPVVVTVVKEVSNPRLPTLRGKQRARQVDIPILTADDLKLDKSKLGLQGSPTRVVKIVKPKITRKTTLLTVKNEATLDQATGALAAFITETCK
ncbi:MAG: electron transfer flavoprotein subunit beta/FixA family protein [Sedimentisphaerales bacterium]|nr:electron transfer flavoprotein subunit beta/FixA family protein [Sedimentisphaerales bacterium]